MQLMPFAAVLALSRPAIYMSAAGLALLLIALWSAKSEIARARGLDKIVALTNICFAVPLAIFGAEHFALIEALANMVPPFMPWRLFWAYLVGVALIAASLSIATGILVRWSGLLFGIMMLLFVAMIHLPGAIATGARVPWTIVFRESSFAGGGWVLAGVAMGASTRYEKSLITIGRILIAIAAIVFGVLHFLHPTGLPVVPLQKQMPSWLPASAVIDYLTGAFLVAAGVCFFLARKTRMAATYLGAWILLLIIVVYVPVLIGALSNPATGTQIEGINYFADTLLFGGVVLSLASAGIASSTFSVTGNTAK